ncbi:type II toxin-antitoxin system prevent-host-death family antitoxin [Deltaproteobacteria bacterium Smac51]|nr:type II toxin-antitoxin system prevent-host-death family antitoxin [Deltaproteobacteria bacterium Smac51]
MIITFTKLKTHISKYLDLVDREEIIIPRNGKRVTNLVDTSDKFDPVKALKGILPVDASLKNAKEEWLARK